MKLRKRAVVLVSITFGLLTLTPQTTLSGVFGARNLDKSSSETTSGGTGNMETISPSNGSTVIEDVPYGGDEEQRFDVYAPSKARGAPVIFMVHGGAWFLGDKAERAVVENKLARWLPRGFIYISTNYRLLPKASAMEQAKDVARAIAAAQDKIATWGGDRSKFILMGHSAGAYAVALLAASPGLANEYGVSPWLGSVILDSAVLNVPEIMDRKHARFYDRAFGQDRQHWEAASPYHLLEKGRSPMLIVCSTQRLDKPCGKADEFAAKASSLGIPVSVLRKDFSHRQINLLLGKDRSYTDQVEIFLRSLDPAVKKAL